MCLIDIFDAENPVGLDQLGVAKALKSTSNFHPKYKTDSNVHLYKLIKGEAGEKLRLGNASN